MWFCCHAPFVCVECHYCSIVCDCKLISPYYDFLLCQYLCLPLCKFSIMRSDTFFLLLMSVSLLSVNLYPYSFSLLLFLTIDLSLMWASECTLICLKLAWECSMFCLFWCDLITSACVAFFSRLLLSRCYQIADAIFNLVCFGTHSRSCVRSFLIHICVTILCHC